VVKGLECVIDRLTMSSHPALSLIRAAITSGGGLFSLSGQTPTTLEAMETSPDRDLHPRQDHRRQGGLPRRGERGEGKGIMLKGINNVRTTDSRISAVPIRGQSAKGTS
jgi:hypothetical protein